MKIVVLSHSDILGGAAIVSFRLMQEFRRLGHQVKMLVFNKQSDDPDVIQVGNNISRSFVFLAERLDIFLHNGLSRKELFKVSSGRYGLNLANNSYVKEADAVMLNWINQGLLSLSAIRRMGREGKKIIWTMHDMWCMTGICHYAHECERYMQFCGECPFLKSKHLNDMSHRVWLRKKSLYDTTKIRFVSISSWQRQNALQSSLMAERDITRIPNAFPVDSFPVKPIRPGEFPGTKGFKNIIVFGAARLDIPIKGLKYAIEALNILVEEHPEFAAKSVAVFYGNVRDAEIFNTLRFPHLLTGTINDPLALQQLYSHAKIVLSTALYEILPGTLIEGMSSGAIPVAFGMGGQVDIIDHKENGYIAEYLNSRDVAEGILWAAASGIKREKQHQYVVNRFSANAIANRYLALIERED